MGRMAVGVCQGPWHAALMAGPTRSPKVKRLAAELERLAAERGVPLEPGVGINIIAEHVEDTANGLGVSVRWALQQYCDDDLPSRIVDGLLRAQPPPPVPPQRVTVYQLARLVMAVTEAVKYARINRPLTPAIADRVVAGGLDLLSHLGSVLAAATEPASKDVVVLDGVIADQTRAILGTFSEQLEAGWSHGAGAGSSRETSQLDAAVLDTVRADAACLSPSAEAEQGESAVVITLKPRDRN